uniref:disease resistance protein Roq1-like n=1 Tax=Erigeron canadensis TaxID=72917 RepID=UPI001CB94260|nr:disease resistance protein Roq1-like [Erigeron canadensis]
MGLVIIVVCICVVILIYKGFFTYKTIPVNRTLPIPNPLIASLSSSFESASPASYDVFLSFRGEDTRKTFVDHLYSALQRHLIHTYKDDETLPRGVSIGPSLLKAIRQSRIAIIIFSKNYADSSWCLDELEYIMKCKDETGLIVMPVFYDVDPSEVRKQKGDFGEGFAKQVANNFTKIESWRKALVDASNLSGWQPKNVANGHESEVIKKIVDTIFDRLYHFISDIDDDLVGMRTRLQEMIAHLEMGSDDVLMVGIWGVGGGGKTTLAASVYMEISRQFEGSCIVENIREKSRKYGFEKLQEDILSSILNKNVEVPSIIEGKNKIKTMLCRRKVLILLDDVDKLDQLQALAGSDKWFGGGSRIIITTRDQHLLDSHKAKNKKVYPVRLLSKDEASQLFKIHAYNENNPLKDFEKFSSHVVEYASGLPLALKVLGSFLYDKNEEEWISALDRLKDIPEKEIVETLKISYDGLNTLEKELFLDIACFLRFSTPHDAMEMLEACGYYPHIGIKILREKALITINRDGEFDMHDLIQEMGHFIVRGENPDNPEKHSRVWKREEINNMCFRGAIMENDNIKVMDYRYYPRDQAHSSRLCMIVSNMKQLRCLWLDIEDGHNDDGGPTFLSNELKYIQWTNYPTSPFPDSFQPVKLGALHLRRSHQKKLWMGHKHLPHLKVLRLTQMVNLVSTPDFSGLPCLQKFILSACPELEEIHPSLGNHASLEYIIVSACDRLRMFPTIVQMEKLKSLQIEYCDAISEFPKIQANMESLVELSLDGNGIKVLPLSIENRCTNLESLNVSGFFELKDIEFNLDALIHLSTLECRQYRRNCTLMFHHFPRSLRKLDLSCSVIKDGEIPSDIGELSNLLELHLRYNEFTRIDFSLSQLTRLKLLNLELCKSLVELPKLPSSLAILLADECKLLTTFGDCYKDCERLCQVSLLDGSIVIDGDRLLECMLQRNAIEDHSMLLELGGREIPKGFIPCLCKGSKCTLQLPNNWCDDFCGFLICAVFKKKSRYEAVKISMQQPMSTEEGMDSRQNDVVWEEGIGDTSTSTWVGYISFGSLRNTFWWDRMPLPCNTLSFSIDEDRFPCSGVGVRLVSRDGRQTDSSDELCDYEPSFRIRHDSAYALTFSLCQYY